ncbi:adenylyl-sulfate kinase [Actinoallomurus spadix]|uniref:Adenylyl-sulfate kinase n=1 Tax=Actinoallomurus spadix TaxID=79912 RepID=A0ABP3GXE0_9ACTN|nr:adenylyl-sulfate kinase [Actinoallomurus spadix]MCO5986895.1 adenylyl-sulfate kinase [Actinoallomurus spadix]
MTTEAGDLRDLPSLTPGPAELADLELLLNGAFQPLTGFLGAVDAATVAAAGRLADGTPWPAAVTLAVPEDLTKEERVVLTDPEGVPLAILHIAETWQDNVSPAGFPGGDPLRASETTSWHAAGRVETLALPEHGTFRRLRLTPREVRAELAGATTLALATRGPLHRRHLGQLRQLAEKLDARLLLMPLIGEGHDDALVRALLAVRRELPAGTLVVPVPLIERPGRDLALAAHVAAAYGATHFFLEPAAGAEEAARAGAQALPLTSGQLPIEPVTPEPWAYDESVEVWRPVSKIEPDHIRPEPTEAELAAMLDRGEKIPEWFTLPAVAEELRRANPPRHERGLTVFFTGLSGSGKSTIARGLADALVERGGRTVTLLDGDVVRRLLSAGLTFSRDDRDLNIRRIGYVAAEITRHGGVAICAPIAPYAATRAEVRRMVNAAGDFVLVHVATPLEECERRDRKGLYAKARAGLIPEFTGISDPYELPDDAELTIDTSQLTPEAAVERVLDLLVAGGWVRSE